VGMVARGYLEDKVIQIPDWTAPERTPRRFR